MNRGNREIALSTICKALNLKMDGNDVVIDGLNLCNRESIHKNILTYVTHEKYCKNLMNNAAVVAVIISEKTLQYMKDILEERGLCYVIADCPEKIFYDIHDFLYYNTDFYDKFNFRSIIGDNCCIHSSAVIEDGVVIGNNVTIGANSVIRHGTVIEDGCVVGCNSTIGSEGFQILNTGGGCRRAVHVGGVTIKENTFVGDNVCICNSLFENTSLIGRNVKIDNLCQIAHNVIIKDNAVITAGCILCGSSVIDEGCWIGVNSSVLNRVEIEKESKIGIGSVVTRNIPAYSLAYGVPARVKEYAPPMISIITTVYNTKVQYLKDYIASIMKQTYQNFNVIIVDDGSRNMETVEFLKQIQEKYNKKVSVFFRECNQGISASRNYALDCANGEYICVIDSDDYYETDFLEKMIQPVIQGVDADMIVCSGYTCVDEKKNFLKINSYKANNNFSYFQMPTGIRLTKRKILVDNHIKFPVGTIYEDSTFCMVETLYSNKIIYVDGHGYINRQHKASYSHGSLYKTITLEQIPYEYIEQHIYDSGILVSATPEKRMAAQGAVMIIVATCCMFFCRKSEKEQIADIVRYSGKFIRKYIKNINKCMYLWCKNAICSFPEKVINVGYGWAVCAHCEKIYIYAINKILNFASSKR